MPIHDKKMSILNFSPESEWRPKHWSIKTWVSLNSTEIEGNEELWTGIYIHVPTIYITKIVECLNLKF